MPSETHRLEDTAMKRAAVVPVIGEQMGQADGWGKSADKAETSSSSSKVAPLGERSAEETDWELGSRSPDHFLCPLDLHHFSRHPGPFPTQPPMTSSTQLS